jgi:uncharacterized protein (TIGR03437 family)
MYKILHTVAIVALALALPLAALAQSNLNLDTGTAVASGGDITFSSSGIAPVGSAKLADLTTLIGAEFSILSSEGSIFESLLATEPYVTTPVPTAELVANECIAVQTNGGNYAALLVKAASSGSVTLQYVTYNTSGAKIQGASGVTLTAGGGSSPGGPTITQVQNNYSWLLPGSLNYGIAPGSIMTIIGSGLSDAASAVLQSSASPGIPKTLNNASVSITVNGTTVQPGIYYAVPTAIAVVVPSSTPIGTGTVTVTHGGTPSAPATIVVVPAALGIDTLNSSGGGPGTIEDASTYAVFTSTSSARPGENIVLWGSGLGADAADSDTIYTSTPHGSSTPLQIYIGGVSANILYHGASGYPGLTQIDATIPANAPTGCAIQVVAVTGTGANAVGSNVVTMPIASNGGTCVDSTPLIDSGTLSTLSGKATVNEGILTLDDFTDYSGSTTTAENIAGAIFQSVTGSNVADNVSCNYPQIGSCILPKQCPSALTGTTTTSPLYAGTVTVSGPAGSPQTLTPNPCVGQTVFGVTIPGCEAQLPSGFIPASGGTFTFTGTAGTGGTAATDVGAFSASVGFLNPITWTNATSISSVTRASGVTVNWTGGAAGTYVFITGDSSSGAASQSFTCVVPATAGTFTVSPGVLMQLPADSNGSLSVENFTDPKTVTIPNLDLAVIIAFTGTTISVPYK